MQTSPQRQHHIKPAHLRAVPSPAPKATAAQDPTPAQLAAWKRLHGYAGMTTLPEPVESFLQVEAAQAHRVDASQLKPSALATVRHHAPDAEQEPLDLWPVIRRIYMVLGAVGLLGVAAVMWGA
jgi:hypothetical protein